MGDKIITRDERVGTIRELLENAEAQLAIALPEHLRVDKLLRMAMTVLQDNTDLLNCTAESVIGAIMQCAQLGLYPDNTVLGHAYLVPFNVKQKDGTWKKRCQLIPGYRGLIDLCHRSGAIQWVDAYAVAEGDEFQYQYGLNPVLDHVPAEPEMDEDGEWKPAALTHVYALGKLRNGDLRFRVMPYRDVESIRKRSRAKDKGPWVTDYVPMAQKTVLRQWCKYIPMSPEVSTAVTLDELHERAIDQRLARLAVDLVPAAQREEEDVVAGDPLDGLAAILEKAKETDAEEIDAEAGKVIADAAAAQVEAVTEDTISMLDAIDAESPIADDPLFLEYQALIKTVFDLHGEEADAKCQALRRTEKLPLNKEFIEFTDKQKEKYIKALKSWIAYSNI